MPDEIPSDLNDLYEGERDADKLFVGEFELVGVWEVSKLAGVEKSRIARWLSEERMPEPIARPKCGPLWRGADIRQWLSEGGAGRTRADAQAAPAAA
jgi:predicted DNA-binding transcriptional regulator AlpA